jgi:hypothetical protein
MHGLTNICTPCDPIIGEALNALLAAKAGSLSLLVALFFRATPSQQFWLSNKRTSHLIGKFLQSSRKLSP